jgi:uncharacterized protein YqeY
MGLQENLSAELLSAMKAKDAVKTSTLRLVIAAFRNEEIKRKKALTDGDALEVIQSEAKRRRESMDEYKKANRADLAAKEEAELSVLQQYLPEPMSEAELQKLVETTIQSVGAKGPQDMGRVMSALMPQIKGRADGKQAQQLVQKLITAAKA